MGKKRKPSKPGSSRPRRPASGAATDGWDIVEAGAGLLEFLGDAVDRNAGAQSWDLKKLAVQGGLRTLRMSGLRKMLAGLTTLDEVLMMTPTDRS